MRLIGESSLIHTLFLLLLSSPRSDETQLGTESESPPEGLLPPVSVTCGHSRSQCHLSSVRPAVQAWQQGAIVEGGRALGAANSTAPSAG
jgi:hypothetical protein